MPRPRLFRRVEGEPAVNYFKPAGIPLSKLKEVVLTIDEFEAIRLKDFEENDQEKSAQKMHISQPTFNRLIRSARKKMAEAIVESKAIKIEGGNYKLSEEFRGRGLGRRQGFGRGNGRRNEM